MAYQTPHRNKSHIRWVGIRVHHAIDSATEEMDDQISQKYYDSWYWGKSDPWGPFDVAESPEANKRQFDLMTEMVQCMHTVSFHNCNSQMYQNDPSSPHVVPPDEYRWEYYNDGASRTDLVQEARDRMDVITQELGVGTQQMVDYYKQRVKYYTGYDITMDPASDANFSSPPKLDFNT